jgi:hypothetical protein
MVSNVREVLPPVVLTPRIQFFSTFLYIWVIILLKCLLQHYPSNVQACSASACSQNWFIRELGINTLAVVAVRLGVESRFLRVIPYEMLRRTPADVCRYLNKVLLAGTGLTFTEQPIGGWRIPLPLR